MVLYGGRLVVETYTIIYLTEQDEYGSMENTFASGLTSKELVTEYNNIIGLETNVVIAIVDAFGNVDVKGDTF